MRDIRIAVDVGGTFADIVAIDVASGDVSVAKVPSIANQAGELAQTLRKAKQDFAGDSVVENLIVGTTVVTNALLENDTAKTALVTTAGFKDILAIGRMHRPSSYDLTAKRAVPLVPEELIFEVEERLGPGGVVFTPLQDAAIDRLVDALAGLEIDSVAICLLYSFVNPEHEQRIAEAIRSRLGLQVTASSDVLPVFREHERMSTSVVNAAMQPVMGKFLDGLGRGLEGAANHIYMMASDGGGLTLSEARRRPSATVLSGPVGGVVGAVKIAGAHGLGDVLTLDIGGTSSDVALVRGGVAPFTTERGVGGHAVAMPSVDVHTVGAGGGSIARIDALGLLRVGPESARAVPGPICYGRGGTQVTVTDCHVALGHMGEDTMLGGDFTVDRQAAIDAIEEQLAKPLGTTWVRAAQGVIEIMVRNVVGALRKISVERGYDPREATLVPFGGAGPLHALEVARELEMKSALIPSVPGVFSARGMLDADIRYASYQTVLRRWDRNADELRRLFAEIEAEVADRARADGMDPATAVVDRSIDMRYLGQSHTLTLALGADELDPAEIDAAFAREHERYYSFSKGHDAEAELVNLRVGLAWPAAAGAGVAEVDVVEGGTEAVPSAWRETWTSSGESRSTPVFFRKDLTVGDVIVGPAVVEQYDTTLLLGDGDRLKVASEHAALVDIAPTAR